MLLGQTAVYTPQEAGLGVILNDLGVVRILVCGRDVLGGVFSIFHRYRQQLRGNLLPAVSARHTGNLTAK